MFVTIGVQMVTDSVASCRKSAAEAIKIMLERLPKNIVSTLFDITITWMLDSKVINELSNNVSKIF